jgi:hypothetical protein
MDLLVQACPANEPLPWFVSLKFNYNKRMVERLGGLPGARWDPKDKVWLVPEETLPIVLSWAEELGFNVAA